MNCITVFSQFRNDKFWEFFYLFWIYLLFKYILLKVQLYLCSNKYYCVKSTHVAVHVCKLVWTKICFESLLFYVLIHVIILDIFSLMTACTFLCYVQLNLPWQCVESDCVQSLSVQCCECLLSRHMEICTQLLYILVPFMWSLFI